MSTWPSQDDHFFSLLVVSDERHAKVRDGVFFFRVGENQSIHNDNDDSSNSSSEISKYHLWWPVGRRRRCRCRVATLWLMMSKKGEPLLRISPIRLVDGMTWRQQTPSLLGRRSGAPNGAATALSDCQRTEGSHPLPTESTTSYPLPILLTLCRCSLLFPPQASLSLSLYLCLYTQYFFSFWFLFSCSHY